MAEIAIISALSCNSHAGQQVDIQFENLWVSNAPEVAMSTAAYGTIKNNGNVSDTLISIRSDAASMVMLHETKMDSGIAGMEHVSSYLIKPGAELILKPMSFHLMLMNLNATFRKNKNVKIWFNFKNSGDIKVEVPILSAEEGQKYTQHYAK